MGKGSWGSWRAEVDFGGNILSAYGMNKEMTERRTRIFDLWLEYGVVL